MGEGVSRAHSGMEPIRLPGDEEIEAAYDQGKGAIIKLFHQAIGKVDQNNIHILRK